MSLSEGVSVRFDEETRKRLKAIAEQAGLKPAELVRRATAEFLDNVESSGTISIPVNIRAQQSTVTGDIHVDRGGKKKKKPRRR